MAGALRKTMLYLGLADDHGEHLDEDYVDEYEDIEDPMSHDFDAQVTPISRAVGTRAAAPVPAAGDLRRITTIHPRSYNDARKIGEAFREGTPVIMNLSDMDDADAKRLVDFSAGLSFGLHGAIERVTNRVFLLSPVHVEVTGDDRPANAESRAAFYNQS